MKKQHLFLLGIFLCVGIILAPAQDRKLLLGAGSAGVTFSPLDIASIAYGYEAGFGVYNDAGTTLATNGQTVQQWNDRSANARNLSQATSGQRPTYNSTGGSNNTPYLAFNPASSQELTRGSAGLGSAPHTVFVVAITDTTSAVHMVILNDNNMKWGRNGINLQFTTLGIADYASSSGTQWVAGTWAIMAYKFDTGFDMSFYKNGSFVQKVNGSADTAGSANLRVGGRGTEYWSGNISAVYAFAADLTSDEMTSMWTYLNNKYAVY